jgi:hypothetical protein
MPVAKDRKAKHVGLSIDGDRRADETETGRRAKRARRFMAFADRQRLKRKWVRLSRLALHYAEMRSPDGLETLADLWISKGYSALLTDIRSGFFTSSTQSKFPERGARLELLYLHPSIPPARMTADWLELLLGVVGVADDSAGRKVSLANTVACCWVPAQLAAAWCEARDLPRLHEKPGRKVKDDALVIAAGLQYRAEGNSLRKAAKMAADDYPEQFGQSAMVDNESEFDRIRRKIKAAERSGARQH